MLVHLQILPKNGCIVSMSIHATTTVVMCRRSMVYAHDAFISQRPVHLYAHSDLCLRRKRQSSVNIAYLVIVILPVNRRSAAANGISRP